MGMTTSLSSKENIARGSCSNTLVSSTKTFFWPFLLLVCWFFDDCCLLLLLVLPLLDLLARCCTGAPPKGAQGQGRAAVTPRPPADGQPTADVSGRRQRQTA